MKLAAHFGPHVNVMVERAAVSVLKGGESGESGDNSVAKFV
jgi:hypothetical protein